MAKPTGFIDYQRQEPPKRPIQERIQDFKEFEALLPVEEIQRQAARCMDCGIPFCHAYGCPLFNQIPDWNDMVYRNHWRRALDLLHATNNFPEVTGRVCPAPCETACTLAINQPAVTIKHLELQIVERGWQEGWIQPEISPFQSSKRVAIVGSGPAGLAAAQQLARKGHAVTVFERANRIGGLLRYGIPDFKLEKWIIDRRLAQMKQEGVIFETGVDAGVDISLRYMQRTFNAILLTTGATVPRDLQIPGRELAGIHPAVDFLTQQNKSLAGDKIAPESIISARGKKVVVLGGGDTGADCVGTCRRQGAQHITQIELLPQPPPTRHPYNPWPTWPNILRSSSSHEEGCQRLWSILTKVFVGTDRIEKIRAVQLRWSEPEVNSRREFREIPGSEFELETNLALLALGFLHPEHGPLIQAANVALNQVGNVVIDENYMSSVPGIFAAGDSVLGPSLIVKVIYQGRQAAEGIDRYLKL